MISVVSVRVGTAQRVDDARLRCLKRRNEPISTREIENLIKRVVPSPSSDYYHKNDDLDAVCEYWNQITNFNPCDNAFPGRVFAAIDMLDWDKELQFLAPKRLLSLNRMDWESRFVVKRNPNVDVDYYPFNGSKWGDLSPPFGWGLGGTPNPRQFKRLMLDPTT